MSGIDFESRLENSIGSVYSKIPYLERTIAKAQSLYNADDDKGARYELESAAAMCIAANEEWAAQKILYYTRFM